MGSQAESHHHNQKPHAVCIPYPAQGHISPMIKLAKLLHFKGFHITFLNTEFNHRRLVKSQGLESVKGLEDFRFETIPDGLPPAEDDTEATQDIPTLSNSLRINCAAPFRDLINRLNGSSSEVPPVSCVVSDGVTSFTVQVAEELNIPEVLFFTISACGFLCYYHYQELVNRGYVPFKDENYFTNGYLDTEIDWISAMKGIRLRDFPTFIQTTDPKAIMLNYNIEQIKNSTRAKAVILNTFEDLEQEVLQPITSIYKLVLTIGPLQLLCNNLIPSSEPINSIGSSLWKEDDTCLKWLDEKPPKSVVYVSFGSITVMNQEQLSEFAWGLANSEKNFLWIIRPDMVLGGGSIALPKEFLEQTKKRRMLARWCPQERVLSHPSIAVFLTHSGWNSSLESISQGVPMICWPFFAEQQTNCRFVCTSWGNGMEIDSNVRRDEVEKQVREMMEGEKGKEMTKKALEWKEKARVASRPGGSSYMNLEKLINQVLVDDGDKNN